jgi:hypothetical protein
LISSAVFGREVPSRFAVLWQLVCEKVSGNSKIAGNPLGLLLPMIFECFCALFVTFFRLYLSFCDRFVWFIELSVLPDDAVCHICDGFEFILICFLLCCFIMSHVGSRSCSPIAPWDMEIDEWAPAYSPFAGDWYSDICDGVGPGGDIAIESAFPERSTNTKPDVASCEGPLICARDIRRVLFLRHCLGVSSLFNGRE